MGTGGEPVVIGEARAALGEGPAWDERTGRLVWVDIKIGRAHV